MTAPCWLTGSSYWPPWMPLSLRSAWSRTLMKEHKVVTSYIARLVSHVFMAACYWLVFPFPESCPPEEEGLIQSKNSHKNQPPGCPSSALQVSTCSSSWEEGPEKAVRPHTQLHQLDWSFTGPWSDLALLKVFQHIGKVATKDRCEHASAAITLDPAPSPLEVTSKRRERQHSTVSVSEITYALWLCVLRDRQTSQTQWCSPICWNMLKIQNQHHVSMCLNS